MLSPIQMEKQADMLVKTSQFRNRFANLGATLGLVAARRRLAPLPGTKNDLFVQNL